MTAEDTEERKLTMDRETIREWAEMYDATPVRTTETADADEAAVPYQLRPETEQTETMESLHWDEFFQDVEEFGLVIVFHDESADRLFEVVGRDQVLAHEPVETTELDERLLAGETITSEFTETTVIDRTIVERATVQSGIVDTEELDSRVVDVKLLSREIVGSHVLDRDLLDEVDQSRFEDMSRLEGGFREELPRPIGVEVEVEEDWSVTREVLERVTIESRIVDVDVTETDEVESETLESSIEIDGLQRSLLESDLIETEADAEEVVESESIESEFHSDDVVRTQLIQRRTVEDDVTERKVIRGELDESEVVQIEINASNPTETAFVDSEDLETEAAPVGVTEYETEATEAEQAEAERSEDGRTGLTEDDEGKPVVDAGGEAVGMVEEVSGSTAYIDPEPGLVDRIKTTLGWGDADEGNYPIEDENIDRVTDDEVRLSVGK
ncbi:hypothetical protein HUG10_06205 [Halorarum halophilum]|uniref:DUF2382 domain-containing protein n=1 Tax=Halorarum halophilum TaxID=2743090 RepID=A0A7D5K6Y5_9EURY|nr:hypothetical protein [Halobaculum halophilum]QLG27159.1 hypothetical protein HUG10_06205 [Halobaculum halophilum]